MMATSPPKRDARNVKWIVGLRGLASISVVFTHLARTFDYDLFFPSDGEDKAPRVMQWPFIRLLFQGRMGVTIFALLTGYVCALKPLKMLRAGERQAALAVVGKSTLKRPFRLVLPATVALLIAWFLAQLGVFAVARSSDSEYMRMSSVRTNDAFYDELWHLWFVGWSTWTTGRQDYDDHHWALLPLLVGSFHVYLALGALMFVRYRYRVAIYLFICGYFWQDERPDNETFPFQVFIGMFLCDFALHQPTQDLIERFQWQRRVVSWSLIVFGLFLASWPFDHPEWAAWSRFLNVFEHILFPQGVNLPKRYTAAGTTFLVVGIQLSPTIRAFLSNKYCMWLGKYSFAVYLVHGTLLRTILIWCIYGVRALPEAEVEEGHYLPRAGTATFLVVLPLWFALVYAVAHLWIVHVDTYCANLTQRIETELCGESDEKGPLLAS